MDAIERRDPGLGELPLSLLQRRSWFLCTAYEGTSSPIVFVANRFSGDLDVTAFTGAVSAVVDRHEALRTTFRVTDGVVTQRVAAPSGLPTELIDLRGRPGAEAEADALVAELTGELLQLDGGQLVRSRLIRTADEQHTWIFAMHHILADGTSAVIVEREVAEVYRAAVTGTPARLPELPIGYGDFAVWQAGGGQAIEEDLLYWRKQLMGVPVLDLPTDHPRPERKNTRAEQVEHQLDVDLAAAVDALAREERCTPFMVLLTAFALVLAGRSGQHDFAIGTPVSGRTLVEVEDAVGLFSNMLALRTDLSGDPTLATALRRAKATTIDALARQAVPFGQIVTELDPPADPSRTQIFQVIFSVHTESGAPLTLPGVRLVPFGVSNTQVIHDLVLDVWRGPTGLALSVRYDTGLFTAASMAALARDFEKALRTLIAEPETRLGELW